MFIVLIKQFLLKLSLRGICLVLYNIPLSSDVYCYRMELVIFLACFVTYALALPFSNLNKCGYESCHPVDPDVVTVHLIPHSHDDVGWLKTVDQYYYGTKNNIQPVGVQTIINSVVRALQENPDRRFIQVETAFLYQWWQEQTEETRQAFVRLVNNGQIEIAGGAWSMNDEAATHYQSLIDQFTHGLQFLQEKLGECGRPKIGWQIDPFGHTREMSNIFSQLGYDAFFLVRIDYRDKTERLRTRTAELVWAGSPSLGKDSNIFTHIFYGHYDSPYGFEFEIKTREDGIVTNKNSPEYNLEDKIKLFKSHVVNRLQNYTTNQILIPMGDDFTFLDAVYNYRNIDALIKGFEDIPQYDPLGRRIKLIYSTPSCYVHAVHKYATEHQLKYALKTDDFMPYASDPHSYWSGYYTSRPTQKRFERMGNNFLQIANQISTSLPSDHLNSQLFELRSIMGVMQHHDAITGTERQLVAHDYAKTWHHAMTLPEHFVSKTILQLLAKDKKNDVPNLSFQSCLLSNITYCDISLEKERFVVSIYNPLSRTVSYNVRLPIGKETDQYEVKELNGEIVTSQIVPSIDDFSYVENIKPGKAELVFTAKDLPALGMKVYYITKSGESAKGIFEFKPTEDTESIGTKDLQIMVHTETGLIMKATYKKFRIQLYQELKYYEGAQSNDNGKSRNSGAYIFRPAENSYGSIPFKPTLKDSYRIYKGDVVDEIHQVYSNWAKQIVRIYKNGENHIEFDWLVGPIDIKDNVNKEVISLYRTNLASGKYFKTDSNGRELLTRARDERHSYNLTQEEGIAQNYYPVTSAITIEDYNRDFEFAVLNDRAQGGSSLQSGQIELMVHRRLLKDDGFGVGEALNETEFNYQGVVARGQHYVTFGLKGYSKKIQREIAERKLLSPWIFIADASAEDHTFDQLANKLNSEVSGLNRALPDHVHILTLQKWNNNRVLLRLENILAKVDGGIDVSVDLRDIFTNFQILSMEETTLGANQPLNEKKKWEWATDYCLDSLEECPLQKNESSNGENTADISNIILSPMQIRTFIVKVKYLY